MGRTAYRDEPCARPGQQGGAQGRDLNTALAMRAISRPWTRNSCARPSSPSTQAATSWACAKRCRRLWTSISTSIRGSPDKKTFMDMRARMVCARHFLARRALPAGSKCRPWQKNSCTRRCGRTAFGDAVASSTSADPILRELSADAHAHRQRPDGRKAPVRRAVIGDGVNRAGTGRHSSAPGAPAAVVVPMHPPPLPWPCRHPGQRRDAVRDRRRPAC